jgi:hypothetical protein
VGADMTTRGARCPHAQKLQASSTLNAPAWGGQVLEGGAHDLLDLALQRSHTSQRLRVCASATAPAGANLTTCVRRQLAAHTHLVYVNAGPEPDTLGGLRRALQVQLLPPHAGGPAVHHAACWCVCVQVGRHPPAVAAGTRRPASRGGPVALPCRRGAVGVGKVA